MPRSWEGAQPIQLKVRELPYTTVMQVPSSSGSRLLRALASVEGRIAKSTGYQCKLVEKSGKALSKFFSTDLSEGICSRMDCVVCLNPNLKDPSLCRVTDVV